MLVLNAEDTRKALSMAEAISAMRWAMAAASSGGAIIPERIHLDLPRDAGIGLFMPAFVPADPDGVFPAAYAVKAFSVMKGNAARGLPAFQGATIVLDPVTGECLGVVDAATLTAFRTGACAGLATDLLARRDARTVGIIGAGPQGAALMQAVCLVRDIEQVWIYDHHPERAEALACSGQSVAVVSSAREAVEGADIVCTATPSLEPVFEEGWIRAGTHVNAIGSFRRDMQELPFETVLRARVFADNREGALSESGDLILPIEAGLFGPEHVLGELGNLVSGAVVGRTGERDVTVYKSVGSAVQDAVAAAVALAGARRLGVGQEVDWG